MEWGGGFLVPAFWDPPTNVYGFLYVRNVESVSVIVINFVALGSPYTSGALKEDHYIDAL